jgi:hypothetical protein
MTLAPLDGAPDAMARWVAVLAPARQLAEILAATDFVPKGMRGNPDAVCAAILYGDELGLGPMQALAGLDVVEGKPRPSAELARALILREGHTITVHEATGTRVRVSGLRAGRPESERVLVEWTTDMARAAGLLNKSNWRSYPRAMLMARATGDLARILFPDVVKGLGYVDERAAQAADLEAWAPSLDTPAPGVAPAADPRPPVAPIGRRTPPRPIEDVDLPGAATGADNAPTGGRTIGDGVTEGPRGPDGVGESGPATPAPDLPPETAIPPDPDGYDPDHERPIRETQRRGLFHAIGRVLGPNAQRDVRLSLVSAILGRDITTTKDLTRGDASRCLDWFDRLDRREVTYTVDDDGLVAVFETTPDPWADIGGTT